MKKRPGDEVDLGYVHIIPLKVFRYSMNTYLICDSLL